MTKSLLNRRLSLQCEQAFVVERMLSGPCVCEAATNGTNRQVQPVTSVQHFVLFSMGTMCVLRTACDRQNQHNKPKNTPSNTSHTNGEWQRVSSYAVQKNDVSTCHPYSGCLYSVPWKNMKELLIFDQFGIVKFVAANGRRSEWMLDESIRWQRLHTCVHLSYAHNVHATLTATSERPK